MAKASKTSACEANKPAVLCKKTVARTMDAYASEVLDMSLSGVTGIAIREWLESQGCVVAERTVYDWLKSHASDRETLRVERVRNIAGSAEYADRVNRVKVLSRLGKKITRSLSSPSDPEDMEFVNGNSLPLARELRDVFKQIQDEVNDIEQPAKRMELLGPDGGAIQVQEVRRTIVG